MTTRRKTLLMTGVAAAAAALVIWAIPGAAQGISGYITGLLGTGGNPGPVPYVGGPSLLREDATQFCWDATNHRLGIGTCAPGVALHVVGSGYITTQLYTNAIAPFSGLGGITFGTNCSSAAAPAVCGSSLAGSVVVAASATTVVVNTTAVSANSQILLTFDSSLGSKLSVTCNTTEPALYGVSARSAGTSFTITSSAPTTNPACFSYLILN